MLQFSSPATLHPPPPLCRWADYYLQHDNMGPTRGVPWDYVVPASAVTELTPMRTAEW